jgi:hypothetical protein
MITVIKQRKINREKTDEVVLFYPDLFSGSIITEIATKLDNRSILSLSVGLAMITEKIYKPRKVNNQAGSIACIIIESSTAIFEKGEEKMTVPCQAGSVFILGSLFRNSWKYTLPVNSIKLYEENYLPGIYLNTKQRFLYAENVRKSLSDIKKLPMWGQCIQKIMPLELLGKGSYANVFKSGYLSQVFAVKMSKVKPEAVEHPYDISFSSWHEVYFLKDIFKPIIEKNICPNLPLLYDNFTCENCDLVIDDEKLHTPCVITVVEIASGNLKNYLQEKRHIEELYSALFQIMAAVHAIQHYGQIMNFDIKKENVLFYDVEAGGYWHYKVKGLDYYVPNFGKLFILNDFGISRTMSPKYPIYKTKEDKLFRLGSRYAIIKDNVFIPFDSISEKEENSHKVEWENGKVSLGAEFKMNRADNSIVKIPVKLTEEIVDYLKMKGSSTNPSSHKFFLDPEIIPPFEFYNDTQDVIRMFIGGKRTTQKGNHKLYSTIPKTFMKELRPYLGEGDSMKDGLFSYNPAEVLAGYFIQSFFEKYRKKPENEKIIATYILSI